VIRFIQHHRTIGRFLARGLLRRWMARRVWIELLSDPVFVAGLEQNMADLRAGRLTVRDPDQQ
jgi:hypothetical protein